MPPFAKIRLEFFSPKFFFILIHLLRKKRGGVNAKQLKVSISTKKNSTNNFVF